MVSSPSFSKTADASHTHTACSGHMALWPNSLPLITNYTRKHCKKPFIVHRCLCFTSLINTDLQPLQVEEKNIVVFFPSEQRVSLHHDESGVGEKNKISKEMIPGLDKFSVSIQQEQDRSREKAFVIGLKSFGLCEYSMEKVKTSQISLNLTI